MRRLLEHGGEAKEFAKRRLVHDNFLIIFVTRRKPHTFGYNDRSPPTGVAYFVNALARSKGFKIDLPSKHGGLFVVKEPKQGNASQYFRAARHRSPPANKLIVESGLHKSSLCNSPGILW